jgi:hypothetical protein
MEELCFSSPICSLPFMASGNTVHAIFTSFLQVLCILCWEGLSYFLLDVSAGLRGSLTFSAY